MGGTKELPHDVGFSEFLTRAAVVVGVAVLVAWLTPWSVLPQRVITPAEPEAALAEQREQVRRKNVDQIAVEARAVGDDELRQIAELEGLRILLLDHPQNRFTDEGISALQKLPNLVHLRLNGEPLDDAELTAVAGLTTLEIVNLPSTAASDQGLAKLATLPALVQLRLRAPKITASGLAHLKQCRRLKQLHLIDVPVGDAGLAELAQIAGLESLYLDGAEAGDAALARFFEQCPKLHVHLDQQHHRRDPGKHRHGS